MSTNRSCSVWAWEFLFAPWRLSSCFDLFTKWLWSSASGLLHVTVNCLCSRKLRLRIENAYSNSKQWVNFLIRKLRKWSIYESIAAMCVCMVMSCTLTLVFHVNFAFLHLCAYEGEYWQWQFTIRAVEWRQNKVLLKIPVFLACS